LYFGFDAVDRGLQRLDKLNPNLGSWFISNVLFNLL